MERYNPFELRRFIVPEFLFGSGAIETVDSYIKNLGAKKILLVTDQGVIHAGWAEVIKRLIKGTNTPFVPYDEVHQNPTDTEVMAGAELYKQEGCDMIVVVGGGSPIDCAKGIGIASANNGYILEFEGIDRVPAQGPPVICIPTTAGSSADISQFAIIHDTEKKNKIVISGKTITPVVSLIDSITTSTMSPELTAATGMDAFINAAEAYISNAGSPITDINAIKALSLISHNLIPSIEHHHDLRYRDRMMLASLLAGLAFSNAGLGLVHAMSHPLGNAQEQHHGGFNAILFEKAVDFNFYSAAERYTDIARGMGVDTDGMGPHRIKDALINEIGSLRHRAGIRCMPGSPVLTKENIPGLAACAVKDIFIRTNPREVKISDIEDIYLKIL